jgi:hypothetical protein
MKQKQTKLNKIINYLNAKGFKVYLAKDEIMAVRDYGHAFVIKVLDEELTEEKEIGLYADMCKELRPEYYFLTNKILKDNWQNEIDGW